MTEEEAKRKWCPFVRLVGIPGSEAEGQSWNRYPGEPIHEHHPATCIASACMAWRWHIETMVITNDGVVPLHKGGPRGYCGLVGKL